MDAEHEQRKAETFQNQQDKTEKERNNLHFSTKKELYNNNNQQVKLDFNINNKQDKASKTLNIITWRFIVYNKNIA